MAPSTALMLVLAGVTLLLLDRQPAKPGTVRFGVTAAVLIGTMGMLACMRWWFGWASPTEELLSGTTERVGRMPLGQMSPLTGGALVLAAVALFLRVPPRGASPLARRTATMLAWLLATLGGTFAASYLAGTPWFYNGTTIPMALWTSVSLLALGVALASSPGVTGSPETATSTGTHPHGRRPPLAVPITLAFIVATVGAFYLHYEQAEIRSRVFREMQATGRLKADQIAHWRRERLDDAQFFTQAAFVRRDVQSFLDQPSSPETRAAILQWFAQLQSGQRYASVILYDARLTPQLSLPEQPGASSTHDLDLLKEALRTRQPVMSDLHFGGGQDGIQMDIAFPVLPPASTSASPPLGVILLQINPRVFLYPLVQTWPTESRTAETLLIRREGPDVLFLNELRHRTNVALRLRLPIDPTNRLPAAIVTTGYTGLVDGLDYRGVHVLADVRPVPDSPWFIVAKVDGEEIFAPLRQAAWVTLVLTATIAALMWLLSWLFWSRQELALERQRHILEDRVQHLMRLANDAILLTDKNWRVLEANARALEFYGCPMPDLMLQPLATLCAPQARADFERQMKSPTIDAGVVFETVHQRKDGTAFAAEISGRTVTIGGVPYGFVVVRNITERKAHEREIARITRLYAALSQVNQAIVRVRSLEELAGEVSRVTVEFGGFQLAWLGRHEPTTGNITPLASAGTPDRLIHGIRHNSRADAGHGCLCATVIREGRPAIVNDLLQEPGMEDWRTAMEQSGLRAAALFPIRQQQALWGVFGVYANEAGVFQEKEIALLAEAAMDISFALDHLLDEQRRREAETETLRLTRLYAALSQVNQAIVRAKSQEELVREVSRVAIEFGGFKLAWVGQHTPETGEIAPLACAGEPQEFILGFRRNTEADPQYRSLCGTAIRENRPRIVNDLLHAEEMRERYPVMEQAGVRSAAVFPIRLQQQVWGVFGVYAGEAQVFQDKEIALLEEAAMDIGFGLEQLQNEQLRQQVEEALRQAEKKYRSIFENAIEGIYQSTPEGTILSANPAMAVIHGYATPEEFIAGIRNAASQLYANPAEREEFKRQLEEHGRVTGRERRVRRKDGRLIWVSTNAQAVRDAGGKLLYYEGTVEDITLRKEAEESLRISESALKQAQRMAGIGNWEWEVLDNQHRWSEEMYRIYGRDPALPPATYPEVSQYFTSDSWTRLSAAVESGLANGAPYECDAEVVRPDGTHRWVTARGEPLRDARGTITGLHGTLQDITERKQAEESMRASEERYRLLADNTDDFVLLNHADGRRLYVSPSYYRVSGWTPEEFQSTDWRTLIHTDDLPAVKRAHTANLAGETTQVEYRWRRKDGSWIWVDTHCKPMAGAGGRVEQMLLWSRDITRRKQAEESLRTSEGRLRTIGDNLPGGALYQLVMPLEGPSHYTYLSAGIETLFGIPVEDVLKHPTAFWDHILPEDRPRLDEMQAHCARSMTVFDCEFRQRTTTGEVKWIHTRSTPRRLEDGSILWDGVVADITERKQTEEEREITVRLLGLFNASSSLNELMREVTTQLHQWFGCDAVGIRLRDGEDYPYVETRGFPAEFIHLENHLCLHDASGRPACDSAGHPLLECMCGNVLCKRFDPGKPFFTARGSFWTHSTTELLASTTEADRQVRTRNRCNGEGYESVALVALRVGDTTYGLLQINDKRRHRFTPQNIVLLERLADNLAVAIAHRQGAEKLQASEAAARILNQRLDALQKAITQLATAKTLDEVMGVARTAARKLTNADGATFILRDNDQCFYADEDAIAPLWKGQRFPMRTCISGWVMLYHKPVCIADIYADSRPYLEAYRSTFVKGMAMVPIRAAEPVGAIGTYWDVTHQATVDEMNLLHSLADAVAVAMENVQSYQTLEQRVRERTAELEYANKELESFSYSVSHDLRAPLRAINGFSRILTEDHAGQLNDEGRRTLGVVCSEAERMGRLIDDLLEFSRMGRQAMRSRTVDMHNAAQAAFDRCVAESPGREIHLHLHPLPPAEGDAALLDHVWTNLISNAIKYTRPRPVAEIEITGQQQGQELVYCVKDNGVGFDMRYANKLFAVFQRLHSGEQFEGTGVGLALVQRIVRRHGGNVWAESTLHQSTSFYFSLPIKKMPHE